ncbi:MAG TPA: NADPH-dependent assimilatory sulfite reductase hemoprotein subunit [Gammaproteobacteria bacterium]|nr:NADPH-dependent assimilatory sulfite reductase hemoprotein subunit [Gammaproteobacteria bacterium]
MTAVETKHSEVEAIKLRSRLLRGTLAAGLEDPVTATISDDDAQISKFHGVYRQDDRDVRAERAAQKLEPAYIFMVRLRVPGGVLTSAQWLAVDEIARTYGNGAARLTTRQSIQLHGVLKRNLKAAMRAIGDAGLTTIAACGDVNRNVVCTPLPEQSTLHGAVYEHAMSVVRLLTPQTGAYREIWMDEPGRANEREPLYGAAYLPRKFKVGFVVPPGNDIDVFAQDLGFIAVQREGVLAGFNVAVGGGLGMTHGDAKTYPRLAEVIGFCLPEEVLGIVEHVVGIQRDYGDRGDRSHARLKYTIDDRGTPWFKQELERRSGFALEAAVPVKLLHSGDRFGWQRGEDGRSHLTLLVPSGRVRDDERRRLRTGINAIAKIHSGDFRLTGNQNLIVANVPPERVEALQRIVSEHGLDTHERLAPLRRNAMSCVALPTCGLAMAEAERYLPELLAKLEPLLARHGLEDEDLVLRLTGCPNGCARPYLAEIALVGKAPGRYSLFLGGSVTGERLNRLYRQNLSEQEILGVLDGLFGEFARGRLKGERFGDFVQRRGLVGAEAAR